MVSTQGSASVAGKVKASGTEQKLFQENVDKYGIDGVANGQNPVGPNNKRKDEYMVAAGAIYVLLFS